MEGFGLSDKSSAVRKKRSNTSCRPRNDSLLPSDYHDVSSLSSTPPSDNVSKVTSDENNEYGSVSRNKELSLNKCTARALSDEASNNGSFRGSNEHIHSGVESKRLSEVVLAPADWRGTSKVGHIGVVSDGLENENKVKKVKLKVGGVTRTIHAKSISDGVSGVGSSATKAFCISDAARLQQKLIGQDNSDIKCSFTSEKGSCLPRGSMEGFLQILFSYWKNWMPEENTSTNQADKHEPIRKSKWISKRRVLNEDEDNEIKYLEKLKTSKATIDYGVDYEDNEEGGS